MKRSICLLALLIISLIALCDTQYTIVGWQGDVKFKPQGKTEWKTAQKEVVLNTLDSIFIQKGAKIVLRNKELDQDFRYEKQGETVVYRIIRECMNRDRQTIFDKVWELLSSFKAPQRAWYEQHKAAGQRVGGSNRGSIDTDSIVQSLCYFTKQALDDNMKQPAPNLILHRFESEQGVAFGMENNTDKGLYVNILHINRDTGKSHLCYPVKNDSLFLPPNTCLNLDGLYFNNTPNNIYIFIACEDSYIPLSINNSLSSKSQEEIRSAKLLYRGFIYR